MNKIPEKIKFQKPVFKIKMLKELRALEAITSAFLESKGSSVFQADFLLISNSQASLETVEIISIVLGLDQRVYWLLSL